MSWHSKKVKRELWIIPLILASEPGQTFSRARMTYVLKALDGPREDGSLVKKVSDGDIWIKAVFTHTAVSECFQGESQEEEWDRSLILIKKYRVIHERNKGAHEFQLEVTEFSYWETQEGFALKNNPVYCMDVPEIQKKVDSILSENEKKNKSSEGLSMSSIALSDLIEQMSPPEDSQAATAPKTPTKSIDKDSSGHGNSLPDSPPLLNPNVLLNELCVINSQERQQLEEIEEWKSDYIPPKMIDSSSNSSSVESPKNIRRTPRRNIENIRNSPKQKGRSLPRNVLKLHKRTLDTSDSSGDIAMPVDKIGKKTSDFCNGDIDLISENQGKDVHSMSVQVGSSLFGDSQEVELSCDKRKVTKGNEKRVSTSAQVGDSLQMMDSDVPSTKGSRVKTLTTRGTDNDISPSGKRNEKELVLALKGNKDSNSNNLTPIVDTQAQRVPSSDSTDGNRQSGTSITGEKETSKVSSGTSRHGEITSQESHYNGLHVDTIVRPTQQQPAKNIGDYQDGVDLSCSVNDTSVEAMDTGEKSDAGETVQRDGSASPITYQSTQQPGSDDQIPNFPVSPVPMLSESQRADTRTLPEGAAFHLGSPRRPSTEDGNEHGRTLSESTPKAPKKQDADLCVGGYFAAGISPPLIMPSTSHIPVGPASPTDLHSPLYPPARPSTSTYTPLLKKSSTRQHSPTRKSPSKTIQLPAIPSTSRSGSIKPRTPVHRERRETLEEEDRLAVLSGRKDHRTSFEDRADTESISSVGTVQLPSSGRELDIDPVAMDEEEKKMAEFRKAASGIEIIEVKMKDVSPKDRKMQRRPTLEITALSPKKLNKFFSSRSQSSSESDGNSVSSNSSQQLKKFSIGKRLNKLDVSLKIVDDIQGKKTNFAVPRHSKSKTPAKKRGDINVLFSSPDRLRKSVSDPTPLSPDGSMIRKRKRIRLYKETMLMPVDEDASQNSESQGSSGQSTGVQSTPDSDMLLISNSSNEAESQNQKAKGKRRTAKRPSKEDDNELPRRSRKKKKLNDKSGSDVVSEDSDDMITPMTREERHKHKEKFLKKSSDKLSPTLTKKLQISPRVNLPSTDQTPSYSLTAAQRSRRRSKTPEGGGAVEVNSESDWTLPFTPLPHEPKSSAARGKTTPTPQDVTSLLMNVVQTCEDDVTGVQTQLLNIPLSQDLAGTLDNYLTLPKFAPWS